MRILQIGKFYPPPFGGMETVLHHVVEELARSTHVDVVVANTRNRTELATVGKVRVWRLRSWGMLAGTSLCPTLPFFLWTLLRRGRYDIVHLHLPNPTAHFAVRWVLPRGAKLVVTWHSDIVRQKKLLKLYTPFQNELLRRADAIVAATPKHFSSSTQLGKEFSRKFVVVPFGIDIDAYTESKLVRVEKELIRSKYGDKPLIFACGRHIYYKGFEYLIQALSSVPRAILMLGGRGPMTEQLKELAEKSGCGDRVHFLGFIPQEYIAGYYHAADVVVMPSVDPSEAFGMVQLEAMACRKPVVCCELYNGVTYVNRHGETGLVVPPRNPEALAEALQLLLRDAELRERMGDAGYRRVNDYFSLAVMRDAHLDLFKRLTGRSTVVQE